MIEKKRRIGVGRLHVDNFPALEAEGLLHQDLPDAKLSRDG